MKNRRQSSNRNHLLIWQLIATYAFLMARPWVAIFGFWLVSGLELAWA
jgi:hypothetical protein